MAISTLPFLWNVIHSAIAGPVRETTHGMLSRRNG